jgi:hypothetical protein
MRNEQALAPNSTLPKFKFPPIPVLTPKVLRCRREPVERNLVLPDRIGRIGGSASELIRESATRPMESAGN